MKKLTPNQILAIQFLPEYSPISSTSIEFYNNGLSRISIVSAVGAKWDEVNAALNSALDKVLPNLLYMGSPAKFYNPFEQMDEEIYGINFEGESLIRLVMRKEPVEVPKEKWPLERVMRQEDGA